MDDRTASKDSGYDATAMSESRGVVYIAAGEEYIRESAASARQLRRVMSDVEVTIFSNEPPESDIFDTHRWLKDPHYNWMDKIEMLPRTPYDRTLYLDSDIYVNEPIQELFDVLTAFNLAAAPDAHQQPVLEDDHHASGLYTERYEPLPEFNCGLIAYRMSNAVERCFDRWRELYDPERH